jgi:two-component system KDP operon response regulator KdpE
MAEGYKTKIMVIDSETDISTLLNIHLRLRGYQVFVANNADESFRLAEMHQPEVILLDVTMPDLGGVAAIGRFLQMTSASVIIISTQDDTPTKIDALDSGADDFVVKPFDFEELMARVRVAIRRNLAATTKTTYPVLSDNYLTIDLNRRSVEKAGERIKLTPLELTLLTLLASQKNILLTRRQILQKVWGKYAEESDILRTTLKQLRRKIEPDPANPIYIITEGRAGYRFVMLNEQI